MSATKTNPVIEWKSIRDKEYLYFTFEGTLKEGDALQGVIKWRELAGLKQGKKELIWNCLKMTGYEPMARNTWQKAIKEHRESIELIWLITDSMLIQAGAKIMSLFTPYSFKIIKSEAEIGK